MSDMPELLPCPFCGGEAHIWEDPSHSKAWFIGCDDDDCLGTINWAESKEVIIAAWNRRADTALGAEAMRRAASAEAIRYVQIRSDQIATEKAKAAHYIDVQQVMRWEAGRIQASAIADAISTLPSPSHADLLAEALRVLLDAPEIMRKISETAERIYDVDASMPHSIAVGMASTLAALKGAGK